MPAFLFTLEETLVSGWNISHKIDRSVQVGLGLSSPWQFDAIILQKKISLCSQYWFVFFPPVLPLSRLKKQLIAVSNWNWTSMGNSPWIHGSTFDQWDLTKLILITWLARGRTQLGTFFPIWSEQRGVEISLAIWPSLVIFSSFDREKL